MIRARPGGDGFGLRSVEELEQMGDKEGWTLEDKLPMPAGNLLLIFARSGATKVEQA